MPSQCDIWPLCLMRGRLGCVNWMCPRACPSWPGDGASEEANRGNPWTQAWRRLIGARAMTQNSYTHAPDGGLCVAMVCIPRVNTPCHPTPPNTSWLFCEPIDKLPQQRKPPPTTPDSRALQSQQHTTCSDARTAAAGRQQAASTSQRGILLQPVRLLSNAAAAAPAAAASGHQWCAWPLLPGVLGLTSARPCLANSLARSSSSVESPGARPHSLGWWSGCTR